MAKFNRKVLFTTILFGISAFSLSVFAAQKNANTNLNFNNSDETSEKKRDDRLYITEDMWQDQHDLLERNNKAFLIEPKMGIPPEVTEDELFNWINEARIYKPKNILRFLWGYRYSIFKTNAMPKSPVDFRLRFCGKEKDGTYTICTDLFGIEETTSVSMNFDRNKKFNFQKPDFQFPLEQVPPPMPIKNNTTMWKQYPNMDASLLNYKTSTENNDLTYGNLYYITENRLKYNVLKNINKLFWNPPKNLTVDDIGVNIVVKDLNKCIIGAQISLNRVLFNGRENNQTIGGNIILYGLNGGYNGPDRDENNIPNQFWHEWPAPIPVAPNTPVKNNIDGLTTSYSGIYSSFLWELRGGDEYKKTVQTANIDKPTLRRIVFENINSFFCNPPSDLKESDITINLISLKPAWGMVRFQVIIEKVLIKGKPDIFEIGGTTVLQGFQKVESSNKYWDEFNDVPWTPLYEEYYTEIPPISLPDGNPSLSKNSDVNNLWLYVGISIGSIALIALIVFLTIYIKKRNHKNKVKINRTPNPNNFPQRPALPNSGKQTINHASPKNSSNNSQTFVKQRTVTVSNNKTKRPTK